MPSSFHFSFHYSRIAQKRNGCTGFFSAEPRLRRSRKIPPYVLQWAKFSAIITVNNLLFIPTALHARFLRDKSLCKFVTLKVVWLP